MLIDGNALSRDISKEVKTKVDGFEKTPHLTIVTCAPNSATKSYLDKKKEKAREVGIAVNVIEFDREATTDDIVASIAKVSDTDGLVVQLPLPSHIDTKAVLKSIPKHFDVDGLNYTKSDDYKILPPVVASIAYIADKYQVNFKNAEVLVIGEGVLVGAPAAKWAREQGSKVTVVNKQSGDYSESLKKADIIISGAGSPGLIKPEMIKDGVVIFDAGTSEENGVIVGDAESACTDKARIITPVPGGIGPMTVAFLLKNLISNES